MGIQVAINHRTSYEYDRRVILSPQSIRLRPAPHRRPGVIEVDPHPAHAWQALVWQSVAKVALHPAGTVLGPRTCRTAVEIAEIWPIRAVSAPLPASSGAPRSFATGCWTPTALYNAARATRLGTETFISDGRHRGAGGGNPVAPGGPTAADSPFPRRPDPLRSPAAYGIDHPSLSYRFSGLFIGPTSQAPRVDAAPAGPPPEPGP